MFVTINETRVRFERRGDGSPVLLLHGWGRDIESLAVLQTHLATYRSTYALDFPGFGLSEPPPTAWSVGDYVCLVTDFMNYFDISKADLLGHSFGGRVAIKLAAAQPERVRRLVLVDSAGVRQYESSLGFRLVGRLASLTKPLLYRLPTRVRKRVRWWLYSSIDSTDYLTAGPMRETYKRVIEEDLEPLLPLVQASTLLLWGSKDKATPLKDARVMAKKIPNAKLVVLPKAGHFSFLDQPTLAQKALDDFFLS